MKKLIKILNRIWNNLRIDYIQDDRTTLLQNFQLREPEKYQKTLQFASIYDDNRLSVDFIIRESAAYWKVEEFMQKIDPLDESVGEILQMANLSPGQSWRESYERGDMHWQTVLNALEDPDFLHRIKVMEERIFRRKSIDAKSA